MIPVKRLLPVASALLLLVFSILLISSSHPLIPSVRGSSRTTSLIGYYPSGWNSSQPSGSNPTITVTQGDTINMQLSSGDNSPHKFLVDFDTDSNPTDTTDCPATDPCSPGTFSTSAITTYSFTVSSTIAPGTYKYICVVHYPGMVGNFVVQAAPTPDFTVAPNPTSMTFVQGSSGTSTITVTSQNGFSGTISLAATTSPVGPSPTLNPTSVTISSGTPGTSTLTVSTTSSTPSATYTVTVSGISGSTSHPTTVTVSVSPPPSQDFTISSSPSSLNVTQGSSASSTITLTSLNGLSALISLTGTVSPSGPSVSFNPNSVSLSAGGSGTSTMTVSAVAGYYSSVATGNYLVNVTATNGSLPHSKTVPVAVTSPTSTTPSPSGVGSLPTGILIGAGAALVSAVGVVVYLVRRKRIAG